MDFLIGESGILERVDEYTLYCHYLGFEPEIRVNYHSPLRDNDENESFGLYPIKNGGNKELMWKDSGDRGEKGDIFILVQKLYGYQYREEAVYRIKQDFGLLGDGSGLDHREKVVRHVLKNREKSDYRVLCRRWENDDFTWWNQWNISRAILDRYRVSPLYMYWANPGQKVPSFAPRRGYVYRVYNRYQLYFPERCKGKKFRMDLGEEHVLGLEQLTQQSDTLIITKSMKDVMTLSSYGYEAISPRSENTPMPPGAFQWINSHYKRVLVLFDNDGKHRAEWYPYPLITVPLSSGSKDISDFNRDHGPGETRELLTWLTAVEAAA